MRLQSYLSRCGIASRRACAESIQAGHASVNGQVVREPGAAVNPARDRITFDGADVQAPATHTTLMLHKPAGYLCSTAGQGAPTIFELIGPQRHRLVCAGRLDKDSEGLVILSSDGDLIQRLTHPRHGHKKTYRVRVAGAVSPATLSLLRSRMRIDDYEIQPVEVSLLRAGKADTELAFVLTEGRNRQIRNMCRQADLHILRLVRTRIGNLKLGTLPARQWRELTPAELAALGTPPPEKTTRRPMRPVRPITPQGRSPAPPPALAAPAARRRERTSPCP